MLYVKVINTDLYDKVDACKNRGSYPYNIPKNNEKAPNTLKYNNEEFNPSFECESGGLYFTNIKNVFICFAYGNTLCIVEPMENAQIVELGDEQTGIKFKTDKLYITQVMEFWNVNTFRYLIELGADIHVANNCALRYSAGLGFIKLVKFLCENGADIHALNDDALRMASDYGHLNIVEYLCENGANINGKEENDENEYSFSLFVSCRNGYLDIVKYLYERGAKMHPMILATATRNNYMDIVKYFNEKKENFNVDGNLPLSLAVRNGHFEMVKYLCEHAGAEVDLFACGLSNEKPKNYDVIYKYLQSRK